MADGQDERPPAWLSRRIPDQIADMRPSGRVLRLLEEMARQARQAERNA